MSDTTSTAEINVNSSAVQSIGSIGWLYGINNTIILTPIFRGNSQPTKVHISREEFELVRHSKDLMKAKAVAALGLVG